MIATMDNRRILPRKNQAISLTRALFNRLADMNVSAKIIGSLAADRFGDRSDIDILITECPRSLKYRIESVVEDALPGFSFDVVYLDEIPDHRVKRFTRDAVDACDLG